MWIKVAQPPTFAAARLGLNLVAEVRRPPHAVSAIMRVGIKTIHVIVSDRPLAGNFVANNMCRYDARGSECYQSQSPTEYLLSLIDPNKSLYALELRICLHRPQHIRSHSHGTKSDRSLSALHWTKVEETGFEDMDLHRWVDVQRPRCDAEDIHPFSGLQFGTSIFFQLLAGFSREIQF